MSLKQAAIPQLSSVPVG